VSTRLHRERGVTLIELVISIVVVAISVSAVLGVLSSTAEHSADAMVVAQAVSIAESYLEEISLKPFDDPDGVDGEGVRAAFDDLNDYHGLVDVGARDQFGNPIPGLGDYTVAVNVVGSAALTGVDAANAARIDVSVTHAAHVNLAVTGYRTRL
jgi:MSHA pilin protein MshD